MHTTDYTVGQYLVDRLRELGIRHLFGVPGPHCSHWLHHYVEESPFIQRFGTTNALNAGYAADGYARMNGMGAVCVPYSVGAFSVLTSIAGAFAERVPVVVINGAPPSPSSVSTAPSVSEDGSNLRVFEEVTCAAEHLSNPEQAPDQVDRALQAAMRHSRPVYLEPQADLYDQPCSPAQSELSAPPTHASDSPPPAATRTITDHLHQANSVLLWGGLELQRYGLEEAFDALVRALDAPYVTSLLNKGLLPEHHPHFAGILDASVMSPDVRALVEKVDYVLGLGIDRHSEPAPQSVIDTDAVTLVHNGLLYDVGDDDPQRTTVESASALHTLLTALRSEEVSPLPSFNGADTAAHARRDRPSGSVPSAEEDPEMTFSGFFSLIDDYVDDDTILMSGTDFERFGAQTLPTHTPSGFVCQAGYDDPGYVTPAAIGADLGSDVERVFVIVGDGGFQKMPQCVGTMAEKCIDPVIFVLNNGIYGADQWRTDPAPFTSEAPFFPQSILQHWHYRNIPDVMGGRGWRVDTYDELRTVVDEAAQYIGGPLVIDVRIQQKSLPPLLKETATLTDYEAETAPNVSLSDNA